MHNLEGVRAIRGKAGGRDMRFQGRDAARGRRMRKDLGRTAGAGVALALVLFLMPALLVRQGEFSQELLPQGTRLSIGRRPASRPPVRTGGG